MEATIDKKKVRSLYNDGSTADRNLLEQLLGKDFFSQKITDRIKTFEDACDEIGIDPNDSNFSTGTPDEIALKKIKVVRNALNPKGWAPDWNNGSQRKWAPWFYLNNPGFRFYVSFYVLSLTRTTGGSRLCFESEELSDYAANQFLDLYKAWLS